MLTSLDSLDLSFKSRSQLGFFGVTLRKLTLNFTVSGILGFFWLVGLSHYRRMGHSSISHP